MFVTNDGERMRIDSSGNLLVGITTARANAGDVQVSKGISFPATQSAQSDVNTLDDYEEGTFTPTVILGGGSVTYTTQTGSYTKVGRLVTLQIQIVVNVASTPSSTVEIGGLPFAVAATQKGAAAIFAAGMTVTSKVFVGRATAGTSVLRLFTYDAGTTANPGADFANGCSLNITASYEV
jgi:hypothetical protein